MKRIIGLFLAVMLITMTVVGCGNNDEEPVVETPVVEEPVAEEIQEETQDEQEIEEDEVVEPEVEEDVVENDVEDKPVVADVNGYTMGTIDGNTFESEWIGVRFTAPEDFIMATQEEVLAILGLGIEIMELDNFAATLMDNNMIIYEMMASTPDGMASVSIITERLMLSGMSTEQWIQASFDSVESMLGWTVHYHDNLERIEFAGREWYIYSATIEALGMDWSYVYLVQRIDNKMVLIQMYSLEGQEDILEVIEAGFAPF